MHTLSLFPSLFTYQLLGVFIVRVALGLTLLRMCYVGIKYNKAEQIEALGKLGLRPAKLFAGLISLIKGIGGALLVVGLWTQGVVIATGGLMLIASLIKFYRPEALPKHKLGFCLLLAALSFALLFLGAGAWAIDLPL